MQLTFFLLMAGALVAAITYYRRGQGGGATPGTALFNGGGGRAGATESGTLYVTGVSPLPDVPGEQYVTISGSISGPSVVAHEVYGRFAWDTNQWPSPGDQIPVAYPEGKPDRWQLGHPGARPYFGSRPEKPRN